MDVEAANQLREEEPRFFVALQVGAGYHPPSDEKAIHFAMKRACLASSSVLRQGAGRCIDAVVAAVQLLKDDPNINAGRGSNLTEDGHVESDASVLDGYSGAFGAVGAVPADMQVVASKVPKRKRFWWLPVVRCKKCHPNCWTIG